MDCTLSSLWIDVGAQITGRLVQGQVEPPPGSGYACAFNLDALVWQYSLPGLGADCAVERCLAFCNELGRLAARAIARLRNIALQAGAVRGGHGGNFH